MIVSVTNPDDGKTWEYYLDDRLKRNLDKVVIPALTKKDEDYVLIIDGKERMGKSVMATQIARYVDPSFSISRECFSPDEFRNAIMNAKHGQAIIFDEAYGGLSSKSSLSSVNKTMVQLLTECGQQNLLLIIVLPSVFLLEWYMAHSRSRVLIHVQKDPKGRKGFWRSFNEDQKTELWINGRKDYKYKVKTRFRGRFTNFYAIDEAQYRAKKDLALKSKWVDDGKTPAAEKRSKTLDERNKLITYIKEIQNLDLKELTECINAVGITMSERQIRRIITGKDDETE